MPNDPHVNSRIGDEVQVYDWYYNGQVLTADLMRTTVGRERQRMALLARLSCGSGILEGLEIAAREDGTPIVTAGVAIDHLGRIFATGEIVLTSLQNSQVADVVLVPKFEDLSIRGNDQEQDHQYAYAVKLEPKIVEQEPIAATRDTQVSQQTQYGSPDETQVKSKRRPELPDELRRLNAFDRFRESTSKQRLPTTERVEFSIGKVHVGRTGKLDVDRQQNYYRNNPRILPCSLADLNEFLGSLRYNPTIEIVTGDDQEIPIHTESAPVVVRVVDVFGNEIPNPNLEIILPAGCQQSEFHDAGQKKDNGRFAFQYTPTQLGRSTIKIELADDRFPSAVRTSGCFVGQKLLSIVSGDHQTGIVNHPLSAPFVVQIAPDLPRESVEKIEFSHVSTEPKTTKIDNDRASITWLPNRLGPMQIVARLFLNDRADAVDEVVFNMFAGRSHITIENGNHQSSLVHHKLLSPMIVKITSPDGTPIPHAQVDVKSVDTEALKNMESEPYVFEKGRNMPKTNKDGITKIHWTPTLAGVTSISMTHVADRLNQVVSGAEAIAFVHCLPNDAADDSSRSVN